MAALSPDRARKELKIIKRWARIHKFTGLADTARRLELTFEQLIRDTKK